MGKWHLLLAFFIFLLPWSTYSQNLKQVQGTVTDSADQKPIPGITVSVKGKNTAVITNNQGEFRISAGDADVLVFSSSTHETVEIRVGSSAMLNVVMARTVSGLGEVVIIGYGAVKRQDLTGSVGIVKVADMVKAPVASFTEALAGRAAGVRVSSADGQPGASQEIVIRGISSLTQSSAPLYVIDGFPIENPESAIFNPNDIESITILKDASATAIYGARGANGVIVIETKKGKLSKPVVTFNTSFGMQQLIKKMEMLSSYEFVKYQEEMNLNKGVPEVTTNRYYSHGRTLDSYKTIEPIDWQDMIFRTGRLQISDLAIRGGNQQTKYSISGSIFNQDGIMLNTGYDRYQGRVALDQALSDKLKVGIIANYASVASNGAVVANGSANHLSYILWQTMAYRPVIGDPALNLTELLVDADNIAQDSRFNPISTINNQYTKNKSNDLLAQAFINYDITKNLTLRISGTQNTRKSKFDQFFNSSTQEGSSLNPRNTRGVNGSTRTTEYNIWSNENTLTYTNVFGGLHSFTALAGFSTQEMKTSVNGFAAQNVPNEQLKMSGLDEGLPYQNYYSESNNTLASFFGRLNYSFDSKYYLTATFRGDGSSKFAEGNKWGYFPSGAIAWNISRENFMKKLMAVSDLKLRGSFGITGNNRVSDFPYLPSLSLPPGIQYSFNNATPSPAIIPSTLANDKLEWETTKQIDLGLDLGLFKNRIELTVDVYRKNTENLLLNANLPPSMGFGTVYKNIGSLKNQGLEITLTTHNVQTKQFAWSSSFNISFNRNEITELAENQEVLFAGGGFIVTNAWVSQIGQPVGMFTGYVFDGIYQYEDFDNPAPGVYVLRKDRPDNGTARGVIQPGDIRFKDLNGDGAINALDQTVIGRSQPLHTGGFTNNFSYKGFDLNVFFQWSYGNQILNVDRYMFEGNGIKMNDINQYASVANRWTPENPSNTLHRTGGQGPLSVFSSRLVEDGSYLRLKTVSLGYNIPPALLRRIKISQLRFSVSAQNLVTWTNYSGRDPEVSVRNSILTPGMDFSAYPQSRSVTFGLNATF